MDAGENYHPHFIKEATDISIKTNLPGLQKLPGAGLRGGALSLATGPLLSCVPKGFRRAEAVTTPSPSPSEKPPLSDTGKRINLHISHFL